MIDRFVNNGAVWGGALLLVLTSALSVRAEDDLYHWAARFEEQVEPILKANCYKCHGNDKAQADLNLALFGADKKNVVDALGLWERVRERVEAGEMLPEGAPDLSAEQKKTLLGWTADTPKPDDCHQIASDATMRWYRGYVMSRRITRYEYNCCIRDLTGVDLRPADSFPADGAGGEGFNTAGGALFTSAILMEKYLAAANRVIETVLPDSASGLSPEIAAAREKLLVAQPSDDLPPREAARRVVAEFARRAYRRPVKGEEVERLLTLYDAKRAEGASHLASVRHMLKAVLISPHFLFLVETAPDEAGGVYRLNPYQLATRVSFFIWSSLPDEELMQLAASKEIYKPEVLRAQVKRMLADPRSRALAENFGAQWLGFDALGVTRFPKLDQSLPPARAEEKKEKLARSMRGEIVAFLHGLFRDDRPLTELLDADYTYLNGRLAEFYDIEDVTGGAFRRVSLSDESRRGGVATMAGILMVTSHPNRTSPVLRGRWVLEALLGSRVPPPPPDVPELEESHASDKQLTLRQRLEEHRKNPACASCHSRMDPLGFGLENFDRLGRWRETDAGQPIDAAGKLPSGATFSGPSELKQLLLKQKKHELLRNLTKKMLGYALGRNLNKFDQCVVRETLEALKKNGDRASILIEQIVLSYPFQHRYYKK